MGIFGKTEPEIVNVLERPLRCVVCGHDRFYPRTAQLHSGVASFFDVELLGPTCTCVVCGACGYVHWVLATD